MKSESSWKKELELLNRKIDRISATNEKLVQQGIKQSSQLSELHDQNKTQSRVIEELSRTVGELKQAIAEKDARIAELEQQKNKNSTNSSKPPSSDFYHKPKPSSINKGGQGPKRKSGGQKGHEGSTMRLKDEPDVVLQCLPSDCIACRHARKCKAQRSVVETRNVVDVLITSEQSRYECVQVLCPRSGKTLKGSFPEGVNTHLQYGTNLKAMVAALSSFGMVGASRICELVEGLAGVSLSDGTVCNILSDCADRCKELEPELRKRLLASEVLHCDETGIRVNGRMQWAHTAATDRVTMITVHPKRGVEGIVAGGVLPHYEGVVAHDCWGSYYNDAFKHATHACCGAHIDRELEGVIQNHRQRWAKSMQNLLSKLYKTKSKLTARGHSNAPKKLVQEFSAGYDRILERGFSRNPYQEPKERKRGKPKKGKVLCLLERLRDLKDDVLRFFTDFRVPFSNNIAERSFRMSKLKMKTAGSFRSADGGSNFCWIFSIIDTVRKNGGNPFKALEQLFNNSFSLAFLD